MSESPVCVGCKKAEGPLRECGDGALRCFKCRAAWLEKVHATPVRIVPPSIGEQARF